MFTPSPNTSSSSAITSPMWTPRRNCMTRSAGSWPLRSAISACIPTADSIAPTTLGNSSRKPSPVFFTNRPP